MARETKFLKLYIPDRSDNYDVERDQNGNFFKLDAAAEQAQRMATDLFSKKQDKNDKGLDTTSKEVVGAINELNNLKQDKQDDGLLTDAKTVVGAINELKEKPGGEKLPIGTIVPFASEIIPLGYLLCDGREIQKKDYPALYELLPFGGKINMDEFRRMAKNEVPVMSSNSQEGFSITSSGIYDSSYDCWKAFNGNYTSGSQAWVGKYGQTSGWIQINYPTKSALSAFKLTARNSDAPIKYFKLCGIANGEEVTLKEATITFNIGETKSFVVDSLEEFEGFKCYVTTTDSYAAIQELELFTVDMKQFPNYGQDKGKKYLPNLKNIEFLKSGQIKIRGNGMALGLTDGKVKYGLGASAYTPSGYQINPVGINPKAYGEQAGDPWEYNAPVTTTLGLTKDSDKTGIVAETFALKFNYMIKATNIEQGEDVTTPVANELNAKIENNRVLASKAWNSENCPWLNSKNGYQKLDNGLLIQWGTVEAVGRNSGKDIIFPITFRSTVFSVSLTGINSTEDNVPDYAPHVRSITTTGMRCCNPDESYNRDMVWIAIGN